MKKAKNIVTVVLLAAFVLGLSVWAVVKPADSLSTSERRPLSQFSSPSVETVLNGKFMSAFEDYSLDQFPLRDRWRTLKALAAYDLFRQRDNNGVYLSGGYAARLDYPLNDSSIDYAAGRFQYVYDRYLADTGSKVYLSVVPDKNYFLAAQGSWPAFDSGELVEKLLAQVDFATYLDIFPLLTVEDYYKTDSHWRQEKIVPVAQYLAQAMGTSISGQFTVNTLDVPYYGVYYGYAALPLPSETIYYLTNDVLDGCTVRNYENGAEGGIYDLDKGRGKDPYELFLSGSVSLLTIENPNAATDKELIVFRDSYGSSLAPLLAEGYAKVTLVDIRYLPAARLGDFVDFHGQDVLFLYSTAVLNNSDTLK